MRSTTTGSSASASSATGTSVHLSNFGDSPPAYHFKAVLRPGVCHTDFHYMRGDMSCPRPAVLGHEGVGIVERLGPNHSGRFNVGDRVALTWRPRCGDCVACVSGNPVMCEKGRLQAASGVLLDGTTRLMSDGEPIHHSLGVSCFAEQAVVSERSVVPIPDDVPTAVAAITGCAVITGLGAVLNVATGGTGRPLLVFGAGGVGLASVIGAALIGAHPIIAIDLDPAKLELARRLGATHTVDGGADDVVDQVLSLIPSGVTYAIEATGNPRTLEQSLACLAPGGTVIAVGLTSVGTTFSVPVNDLVQRPKHIRGSLYGSTNPTLDLPRILDLYRAGKVPLDSLIAAELPLSRVNEAYDRLPGTVGRSLLIP
jgi:Zn-dependent alcohol dehydrogenase